MGFYHYSVLARRRLSGSFAGWRTFINGGMVLILALVASSSQAAVRTAESFYSPGAPIYGKSQLGNELNYLVSMYGANARVGVYVKSMKSGKIYYTHNVTQPFVPASTMKILTAEAALLFLGPEYRFSTQLLTDAKSIKGGVLQGNLYVVLTGDPSLTFDDINELMQTLKSQQIHAVSGNVYIDNSAYDKRFYGPGWDGKDKGYCYAAPISASIINHNCLPFKVSPSRVGQAAQLVKSPSHFYPDIRNSVVTKSNKARSCGLHFSKEAGQAVTLDGCMPRGQSDWGINYVVTDIPDYNRKLFKSVLQKSGVKVYGSVTFGSAPLKLSAIGTHSSVPLRDLITEMLKKSDNIIAGALFKKIGQLYSHAPGSWENGSLAVSAILSDKAKLDNKGLRILDGSGLSSSNLTTPSQLMQVLDYAFHSYATSYEFVSALPVAGVDGTLKHRMTNLAYRVRAKTGTISGVVSLAGYTVAANKEPLAFVIMINGSKGMTWRYRTLEDNIVTALTRLRP